MSNKSVLTNAGKRIMPGLAAIVRTWKGEITAAGIHNTEFYMDVEYAEAVKVKTLASILEPWEQPWLKPWLNMTKFVDQIWWVAEFNFNGDPPPVGGLRIRLGHGC
ncbi:hypothetical protein WN944_013879 [Citrus x changshan-huyou]|uniref:Uncharacterized protein n=1 Tax=Citrus x changshan-huyou TaxID=2935761 RepID=A0AAP0QIA6_9ROSI